MGSLRKIGRNWQVDTCRNGVRVRKIVGPNKRIALQIMDEIEGRQARGEYGLIKNDVSVRSLFDCYRRYSETNLTSKTALRYGNVIDRFLEFLKTRPQVIMGKHMSLALMEDFRQHRLHSDRPPKTKSMNFELKALRTIFNYGIKWELLDRNPTHGIRFQKITDAKPLCFLSKEEIERLLKVSDEDLQDVTKGYVLTGMRKGELEHLTWEDIDFVNELILIRYKPDWHPKSGERDIPMNAEIKAVLLRLSRAKDHQRFVFTRKGKPLFATNFRKRLINAAKRAGIENLTSIHSLRHTFGSWLVRNGVELPVIQKLMGHSDIRTTMIYVHTTTEQHKAAVERLTL